VKLREINSIFNKLHEQVIKTNHIPVYKHMKNKIFIMYGLTSRNLRPNPVFTSISVLLCERSNGMSTSVLGVLGVMPETDLYNIDLI
jgi:cyanate permease